MQKERIRVDCLYTDNDQSSYTFDLPDYQRLENFIKKYMGQARYLIIMNHDRFSRNLTEALAKTSELEDKYRIKVLACNEPIGIITEKWKEGEELLPHLSSLKHILFQPEPEEN